MPRLFDHLVGALLKQQGHVQPEGLSRLKIDHQLLFDRRLHWHVSWLLTFEDAVNVACCSGGMDRSCQGHKRLDHH